MTVHDVWPTPMCDCRGIPREQYERTYILLPEYSNVEWRLCAAIAVGNRTVGHSADDGGIGDLDARNVIAINPKDIGTGLTQSWFDEHYPGTKMVAIEASTPWEMAVKLLPDLIGDIAQAQDWYDVDFGEHPGGGTIRDYGCLLTAWSIILRRVYGRNVAPPWLDKLFVVARSVFSSDNILNWENAVALFPIFDDSIREDWTITLPRLLVLLADRWEVVLRRGAPGNAHFVYLENIGPDETINIIDTQDGRRKTWELQWITGIRAAHRR